MKISCIIPTCDRSELLQEALASVRSQTRQPDEILIVNNGGEKLDEAFLGYGTVLDIMPHAGAAQARNFGACIASGDLLAFLDDDDLWNPQYLEYAEKAFIYSVSCVISRLDKKTGEKVNRFKDASGKVTVAEIFIGNPGITGSNIVIRKNAFFAAGGFDPKLPPSEDKSLVLELLRQEFAVATLPENAAILREHSGPRLTDALKMSEGIRQFARKYGRLMDRSTYFFNQKKIYGYKYQAGHVFSGIPFLLFSVLVKIAKLSR